MTLRDLISKYQATLQKYARHRKEITHENVFQNGNDELQAVINHALAQLVEPNSRIIGAEHLFELSKKAEAGKKCLILPEHYSNFDYPLIIKFLQDCGAAGEKLSKQCIAMAGVKLSEENDAISMLTDGYDTIFVYPGRSLEKITDKALLETELQKARRINIASMRKMEELRSEGRIVVVFPTGTRYRPGQPETKKAIREIDSYIKTSDYMVLLSINGNCLEVNPTSDMTLDIVKKDTIILEASEVLDCKSFRTEILQGLKDGADKKQCIADEIMARLEIMHNRH